MPNLDVLKQRVEDAERRLLSVHSTRERECDALMEMWHQIRSKFQDQEQEIADYRSRLTALQDMNVELTSMIDSMLGSIEGSVERSSDHAVPEITGMAKELLESEPPADPDADLSDISLDELEDDDTTGLGSVLNSEIKDVGLAPANGNVGAANGHLDERPVHGHEYGNGVAATTKDTSDTMGDDGEVLELTEPALATEPSSAGIRSLITRIERAVSKSAGSADENGGDGGADQELEEIEHLRNELNGLRARISATGPAE